MKPKPRFKILDWAGNDCFKGRQFKTFDDAWEYIYSKFEHLSDTEAEAEFGEYTVVETIGAT